MATAPDGIPASPKTVSLDANKLNSLPRNRQSKAKLETSPDVVVVPKDFLPKQGRKLGGGYTVGKAIGAGLQARCTHHGSTVIVFLPLQCPVANPLITFRQACMSSFAMTELLIRSRY